jgi:hypothetical protein
MTQLKNQACFCLLFVLPFAAHAASIVGQLNVDPNASGGTGDSDQILNTAGSLTGEATGGFASSGAGYLMINYGVIKMSGDAFGDLDTGARGIFEDNIVITAPGVATGTVGTLDYSISVTGSIEGIAGRGSATWYLQSEFNGGAAAITATATANSPELSPPGYTGAPFGVYSAIVSFQYGVSIPIEVELQSSAVAEYDNLGGPGGAQFDLAHSLYWGGITDLTAGGSPVGTFTVTSDSGANYADSFVPPAAPEPGTATLLAGALMVGLGLARRRVARA